MISAETLQKVKVKKEKKIAVTNCCTRTSKAKAQKEYSDARRIVKKSITHQLNSGEAAGQTIFQQKH